MAEDKKYKNSCSHDGKIVGYLPPNVRKEVDNLLLDTSKYRSESAVVVQAVKLLISAAKNELKK